MPRQTKSNVPAAVLRWSIERAAIEFGLSMMTLRKSLAKSSAIPDADGLFTTQQIIVALHGSMDVEKLATQKEIRRKLELENAVTEGTVLNRAALSKGFAELADALQQTVINSSLPREAQENFLHNLSSWPVILEGIARSQSKLRNGEKPRQEED
jgi:hypothetical protein